MPLRRYLQEDFNAYANDTGIDPFEAYTVLMEYLTKNSILYNTYAQSTITSGGHARNPGLSLGEIITKNVTYAQDMAEELYGNGQLNPKHTIEASTLGLVDHWKEKDYMTFWFNTLARPATSVTGGYRTDTLRELFENSAATVDLDKFNDYTLSNEQRAQYYISYADAAVAGLRKFGEFSHVDRLVAVSETKGSLGASTERYFTKKLGGKVYNLALAQLGGQDLHQARLNPSLVPDTDELVRYGAQVFDPRSQQQIVLVEVAED